MYFTTYTPFVTFFSHILVSVLFVKAKIQKVIFFSVMLSVFLFSY